MCARNLSVLLTVIGALAALYASSCGAVRPMARQEVTPPAAVGTGLPSIDALLSQRHASVSQDEVADGRDTYSRSSNALDNGTFLDLLSAPSGLAWGVWAWNGTGRDLVSLEYDFETAEGDECYVAVANYDTRAWDWSGPFAEDASVPLDDALNRSEEGMVMCAVVAWDGSQPTVRAITLRSDTSGNVPPKADLQADSLSGHAPLSVNYDASDSTDSDGVIADYEWDLDGDRVYNEAGMEEQARGFPTTSFTYDTPGAQRVRVRVTDDGGIPSLDWVELTVTDPLLGPTANFELFPPSGTTPLHVDFDAGSSLDPDGTIVDYEWDLDGNAAYNEPGPEADARGLATASFDYYSAGDVAVNLRVTDSDRLTDECSKTVEVSGNEAPEADLQATPDAGLAPLEVDFDASASSDADGTIVKFEFDFGEGAGWEDYGAVAMATHTYTAEGSYLAQVRVTDDIGARAIATALVIAGVFQIVDLSTSKWTHHQSGSETPATLTCTTSFPADSYEWTASVGGDPAGNGSTATWSPAGSPPLGKSTITCTAHLGAFSDSVSIDLIITDLTIDTQYGTAGKYSDFTASCLNTLASGGAIEDRSFSSVASGKVVLAMRWALWDYYGKQELPYLQTMAAEFEPEGFEMITNNNDSGDDNEVIKVYFSSQAPQYSNIISFFGDEDTAFWVPMGYTIGIPYHILLDKDGYVREEWLGGHGPGTYDFYTPYVKSLLGLP